MTWDRAIKESPEQTAVLRKGDYCYLKYPNGSVFHATAGNWKIINKCHGADARINGNWEPLGKRLN